MQSMTASPSPLTYLLIIRNRSVQLEYNVDERWRYPTKSILLICVIEMCEDVC